MLKYAGDKAEAPKYFHGTGNSLLAGGPAEAGDEALAAGIFAAQPLQPHSSYLHAVHSLQAKQDEAAEVLQLQRWQAANEAQQQQQEAEQAERQQQAKHRAEKAACQARGKQVPAPSICASVACAVTVAARS